MQIPPGSLLHGGVCAFDQACNECCTSRRLDTRDQTSTAGVVDRAVAAAVEAYHCKWPALTLRNSVLELRLRGGARSARSIKKQLQKGLQSKMKKQHGKGRGVGSLSGGCTSKEEAPFSSGRVLSNGGTAQGQHRQVDLSHAPLPSMSLAAFAFSAKHILRWIELYLYVNAHTYRTAYARGVPCREKAPIR